MIQILATLILMGALIFSIAKKYKTSVVLLALSLIAYAGLTIASGSIMGDDTSGSVFFDIFEMIRKTGSGAISGNVFIVMSLYGYIVYMQHIKASEMFATIVGAPLRKLKKPYLMAALMIIVGNLIKIVIPSGISVAALMIATLYPVLLQIGCSRSTASSAVLLCYFTCWGPSDASLYTALSLTGIEGVSVTEWFVNSQIPVTLLTLIAVAIIFIPVSKFFDKRETAEKTDEIMEAKTAKDIGVPYFYALLPLLPLVVILVFSELIMKSIVISVIAASFFCMVVAVIIHSISTRRFSESFNGASIIFDGMGDYFKGPGILIIFGTLFANALNGIGGMKLIVNLISGMNGGATLAIFLTALLGILIMGLTGVFNGNVPLIIPLMYSIIEANNLPPLPLLHLALTGLAGGSAVTPIAGASLYVASATNVSILTCVKRNIIPMVSGILVAATTVVVFFI